MPHPLPDVQQILSRGLNFECLVEVKDQIPYILCGVVQLFLRKLALMSDKRFL